MVTFLEQLHLLRGYSNNALALIDIGVCEPQVVIHPGTNICGFRFIRRLEYHRDGAFTSRLNCGLDGVSKIVGGGLSRVSYNQVLYPVAIDRVGAVIGYSKLSSIKEDMSAQLPFGGLFGGIYKISCSKKQKASCNSQNDSEGGNYESPERGEELVSRFNVADKSFPIVALFLIFGPALGLLLSIFVWWWLSVGVLVGWFGLVLFLMTLAIWF